MVDFDSLNEQLIELKDDIILYFNDCTNYELIAWGIFALGFLLLIIGFFLL